MNILWYFHSLSYFGALWKFLLQLSRVLITQICVLLSDWGKKKGIVPVSLMPALIGSEWWSKTKRFNECVCMCVLLCVFPLKGLSFCYSLQPSNELQQKWHTALYMEQVSEGVWFYPSCGERLNMCLEFFGAFQSLKMKNMAISQKLTFFLVFTRLFDNVNGCYFEV